MREILSKYMSSTIDNYPQFENELLWYWTDIVFASQYYHPAVPDTLQKGYQENKVVTIYIIPFHVFLLFFVQKLVS